MPYVVLVVGTAALVLIWVRYVPFRKERKRELASKQARSELTVYVRKDITQRTILSVVGSAALIWAMWAWGVQGIQEQQEQTAREQTWISTFSTRHQTAWNEDCYGILNSKDAMGVLYDQQTGQPLSESWCRERWSPPVIPQEYSTYDLDQPEKTPPFASQALFGERTDRTLCADPEMQTCYIWDDFVVIPPPEPGW